MKKIWTVLSLSLAGAVGVVLPTAFAAEELPSSLDTIKVGMRLEGSAEPASLGNISIFSALSVGFGSTESGTEPWVTDGSSSGTFELKDLNEGSGSSYPHKFTVVGDSVFFVANDGVHGYELWVTDGTADGTVMVKDIEPGADGSWPGYGDSSPSYGTITRGDGLYPVGDLLYFVATTTDEGRELWKSDGTSVGTVLVGEIKAGADDGVFGGGPIHGVDAGVVLAGNLSSGYGFTYYLHNGTEFAEIASDLSGVSGSTPVAIYPVGGADQVMVQTKIGDNEEIWVTDGSSASKIADGRLDGWAYGAMETASGTYFARTAQISSVWNSDLWFYDGSTAVQAADVYPDSSADWYQLYTMLGDLLIFRASDGTHGNECWVTDGTGSGTVMLGDVKSGSEGDCTGAVSSGDLAFFAASDDGDYGLAYPRTMWVTDGTPSGTARVSSAAAGVGTPFKVGDTVAAFANFNDSYSDDYSSEGLVKVGIGSNSSLVDVSVMAGTSRDLSGPPSDPYPALTPEFSPEILEYSIELNETYNTLIIDRVTMSGAPGGPVGFTLNGEVIDLDEETFELVDPDPTFIEIEVTAADGSSTTYTIAVSVNGVAPTTTTTTEAPASTEAPATTVADGSSSTTPSLVTSANQEAVSAPAGSAKLLINGELVEVDLVQAPEELRRSVAGARTFAQVRALQTLAEDMVAAVQAVLGEGVTLPITVTNTDTGATITGLVSDPVMGEPMAVPVEDVLLIVNQSLALMVGGADGTGDPANIAFDGVLEFGEGGYVAVLAYGLTPGAAGEIVVMSTPRLLDTFTVDTDGGVAVQAEIPSDLAAGEHTVVVAIDGQSASLGFRVLPEMTLPSTGSDSTPFPVAMLVLAVGGLAMLLVTRRRSTI